MNGLVPPLTASSTRSSQVVSAALQSLVDPNDFISSDFDLESWLNGVFLKADNTIRLDNNFLGNDDSIDDSIDDSSNSTNETTSNRLTLGQPHQLSGKEKHNSNNTTDRWESIILSQLESLSFELSSQLDSLSTSTLSSLPQILHDLLESKRHVTTLSSKVKQRKEGMLKSRVIGKIEEVSHTTGHEDQARNKRQTFEYLTKVDTVKTRMEASKKLLKEAENWNTLPVEMDGIFASKDHFAAASRLQEAQRSLVLLTGAPDYEERKNMLIGLQNKLEVLLSSQVIAALNDRDIEGSKRLYRIFLQIQRGNEFCTYYYRSRKSSIMNIWEGLKSDASQTTDGAFLNIMESFYADVDKLMSKEALWLPYVFPQPMNILRELAKDIFNTISNDIKSKLSTLKDNFAVIVQIYVVACSYGVRLEKLLADVSNADGVATSSSNPVNRLNADGLSVQTSKSFYN